jgi:hypothetical protein
MMTAQQQTGQEAASISLLIPSRPGLSTLLVRKQSVVSGATTMVSWLCERPAAPGATLSPQALITLYLASKPLRFLASVHLADMASSCTRLWDPASNFMVHASLQYAQGWMGRTLMLSDADCDAHAVDFRVRGACACWQHVLIKRLHHFVAAISSLCKYMAGSSPYRSLGLHTRAITGGRHLCCVCVSLS